MLIEVGDTAPCSLQFCGAGFGLASYAVLRPGWLYNSAPFIECIMHLGDFRISTM